ncbi:MAG TPA: prepilin peptidase [Anaeromyxobacteraceae bacterium]|nr:prepilin peptidase [Anaeromyxobacteraceae bacterium]
MHEILDTVPRPLAAAWVACLGAVVGSFLNVVIARLPRGDSVVRPRSRCPRCGAPIAWYDNVPVLSWILLRARCRACAAPISWRYPLVEALAAGAALAAFFRHGLGGAFAAELTFAAVLLALAFIDLDTWLLPHALTWPLIAAGWVAAAAGLGPATLRGSLWGAGLGFAAFAAVAWAGERVFRKEALGFGDVWLLAGIGAWLGVKALLPVVLLASLQGSLVGIALILLGKATPGRPISTETTSPTAPPAATQIPTGPSAAAQIQAATSSPSPIARPSGGDWVPPRNAVPFGPFLALGALEWLWLGDGLARLVPALGIFR